jgi:hypothetical protein
MKRIAFTLALGSILLVMVAGLAVAQPQSTSLKEERQGDVRYLSGGIGLEERDDMEARAREFNLKLVFAMTSREYLSSVKVVVLDAGGKTVLSAESEGPWFFAKLPNGQYTVQAAMGNQKEVRRVTVGKGLQTLNFLWK